MNNNIINSISNQELENLKDSFCTILSYIILQRNGIIQPNCMYTNIEEKETKPKEEYLSKQQVIEQYHPLFTEYGLTQAIHTNEVPYIKRGKKYFFSRQDIETWISNKGSSQNSTRVKYV